MNEKHLAPNSLLENRYKIVKLLAQGGMGAVYEAKDQRLGGKVALKKTIFTDDEYLQKQFEREARLLASLRHIGLPKVIDHFVNEHGQFLVMEFIPGQDLKSSLDQRKQPFPYQEVLVWGDQLLNVLEYLHSRQPPVYHRDIKPQNLKLDDEGIIILLDFGLAKGSAPDMTCLEAGNTLLGCTPDYAPLEQLLRIDQFTRRATSMLDATQLRQIMSEYTDARADLYSLAATMYHLMTGTIPPNAVERFLASVQSKPDPLQLASQVRPDVPAHVGAFLMQAMGTKREKRFASAKAMRRALQEIIAPAKNEGQQIRDTGKIQSEDNRPRLNFKGSKEPRKANASIQPSPGALNINPVAPPRNDAVKVAEEIKPRPIKMACTPPFHKTKETGLPPRLNFKAIKGSQGSKASTQSARGTLKTSPVGASKKVKK